MKFQPTHNGLNGASLAAPATLVATWFGVGLIPFAAGTWGSLAALPFAWFIHGWFGPIGLLAATALVAIGGVWASARVIARTGKQDPGAVVIDEVAGMWLTLALAPRVWWAYAIGFVLFRVVDIVKPWPAGWADRSLHGGIGAMADDLLAAIWSALALWLIVTYVPVARVLGL